MTGVSDPLVTLLAVQGYVLRHLRFVRGLAAVSAAGQTEQAGTDQGSGIATAGEGRKEGIGSVGCVGPCLRSRQGHDRRVLRGRGQLPSSWPLSCPAFELVPHSAAVQVLTSIAAQLSDCVVQAFSAAAYTQGTGEETARRCLQDVRRRSEQLFIRYARLERKVTAAATNAADGRIFHCSPELA